MLDAGGRETWLRMRSQFPESTQSKLRIGLFGVGSKPMSG